jgi:hypothetical protein
MIMPWGAQSDHSSTDCLGVPFDCSQEQIPISGGSILSILFILSEKEASSVAT